jgi:regulatory protein
MDNFNIFYKKALNFLSFRPRSEKEIRNYLSGKERPSFIRKIIPSEETIEKIISKLKEYKFLNDEEFAKWWIEQRTLIKPKAGRVIRMELKQKGIDKELVDELLKNEKESDFEKAKKLAEKRMPRYSKIKEKRKVFEKLGRFLVSKGFNYDIIKEVIDQIFDKEYN